MAALTCAIALPDSPRAALWPVLLCWARARPIAMLGRGAAQAWSGASTVFIAAVIALGPSTTQDLRPDTPAGGLTRDVILLLRAVLKGELARTSVTQTLSLRPSGTPSDIARGQWGDLFGGHAGPQGVSARSGMLALDAMRHPETLAASSGFRAGWGR